MHKIIWNRSRVKADILEVMFTMVTVGFWFLPEAVQWPLMLVTSEYLLIDLKALHASMEPILEQGSGNLHPGFSI